MLREYPAFSATLNVDDFLESIRDRKGDKNHLAVDASDDDGDMVPYDATEYGPDGELDASKILSNLCALWQMNVTITAEPGGIKRSEEQVDAADALSSPKRQRQSCGHDLGESVMAMSPGIRLNCKQAAEMKPVRSSMLCQEPDCVYSRSEPGKPCRKTKKTVYCLWCDPQALRKAVLGGGNHLGNIKKSLTSFHATNMKVYESALSKLPPDFDDSRKRTCSNPACVFDRAGYGRPAWTTNKFCIWCDDSAMQQATKTSYTIGNIKNSLSTFKAANMEVYEKACLRLPLGFDQGPSKHLCQRHGCVFSWETPGNRAQERDVDRIYAAGVTPR